MMKEFYLTLLSDSSLNTFVNNKQSSFTVRLDHPIQIDKDNWEVGLVEIITPSEVKNVTDENNFFFLKFFDKLLSSKLDAAEFEPVCRETATCIDMKLKVPTGYYSTPQHLIEEIHNTINERYSTTLRNSNASIRFEYGINNARVKTYFQDPNRVKLILPTPLAEKLGVNPKYFNKPIGNEKHAFTHSVDLNTNIHQLYMYSDIASYTFLGDVTAPVLRVVPFETMKERHHLHQEFVNVHYIPVAKSFIDQVHISIKGNTGDNVPFITGKTLVKLHFKQKE